MMARLWLTNVAAHAVQAGLLTAAAAGLHRWIRRAHPALRLALWQMVLAANIVAPLLQPWRPLAVAGSSVATIALSATESVQAGAAAQGMSAPALLLSILGLGVLARLAWLGVGVVKLQRVERASERLTKLPVGVCRAIDEIGVAAEFRVSDALGPISFGALRPRIVLPRRFLSLDDASQRLIAAHELHHVRRRDWLHALIEEATVALLWYQPWIWWIRAEIRLAREQVVDRLVAGHRPERDAYVQILLAMAGHPVPALSSGVAFPRVRELRDRIHALYKEVPMSGVRIVFTGALCGVGIVSIASAAAVAFPLHVSVPPVAVLTHAAQADEPVRIGKDVKPPRKVKDVKPVYPPEAKEAGIQGVVVLDAVVDRAGRVSGVEVIQSVPELDQAAVDAVQQWEFEPTYIKGKTVSVRMTITVNFKLQ